MINQAMVIIGNRAGNKILGLSILMRAVLATGQAGIKKILLLGRGDKAEAELAANIKNDFRVKKSGCQIDYVAGHVNKNEIKFFEVNQPFWLVEADLVFDSAGMKDLSSSQPDSAGIIAFTHNRAGSENVGNVLWSGLAICSPDVLPIIIEHCSAYQRQKETIEEDGPNWFIELASNNVKVSHQEFSGKFAVKINSNQSEKLAVRMLLQSVRKPVDGFIARNFNRHISLFFTRHMLRFSPDPKILSLLTFAIGLTGTWFVSRGSNFWTFVLGGAFFEFASIFDGCDGEVARLTYRNSEKGESFDVTLDALTYILFFSGLGVGLFRNTGHKIYLILAGILLLSMAVYYLLLFVYTRKSGLRSNIVMVAKTIEKKPRLTGSANFLDKIASRLAFVVRRDFFATLVFLLMLVGLETQLLFLVVMGSVLESAYFSTFVNRELKKMNQNKVCS